MKRIKKMNPKAARTVMAMASCSCGSCTCRYCNVYMANPHEAEVGSNAISAAVSGNYWG